MVAKSESKETKQEVATQIGVRTRFEKVTSNTDLTVTNTSPGVIDTGMVIPEDCIGLFRFYPGGDEQKTRRLTAAQCVFTPCEAVKLKISLIGANIAFRVSKGMHLGTMILIPIDEA